MPWEPKKHNLKKEQKHKFTSRIAPSRRGYDHHWRKLRLTILQEEPLCRSCQEPATCVDHITPLSQGGDNSRWNLQPLCASCHNRKTWYETFNHEGKMRKK